MFLYQLACGALDLSEEELKALTGEDASQDARESLKSMKPYDGTESDDVCSWLADIMVVLDVESISKQKIDFSTWNGASTEIVAKPDLVNPLDPESGLEDPAFMLLFAPRYLDRDLSVDWGDGTVDVVKFDASKASEYSFTMDATTMLNAEVYMDKSASSIGG